MRGDHVMSKSFNVCFNFCRAIWPNEHTHTRNLLEQFNIYYSVKKKFNSELNRNGSELKTIVQKLSQLKKETKNMETFSIS